MGLFTFHQRQVERALIAVAWSIPARNDFGWYDLGPAIKCEIAGLSRIVGLSRAGHVSCLSRTLLGDAAFNAAR